MKHREKQTMQKITERFKDGYIHTVETEDYAEKVQAQFGLEIKDCPTVISAKRWISHQQAKVQRCDGGDTVKCLGCGGTKFLMDAMLLVDTATNEVFRAEQGENCPMWCQTCDLAAGDQE